LLPWSRVACAFLDRDRDGLLVFFVGIILFRVAAAVYFLADLLVAAAPVVVLARRVTVSHPAPHASRRVESEILGAGRAFIQEKQDHNLPPRMGAYTFSLVDLEDYASGL
jgi:hypothetical protein